MNTLSRAITARFFPNPQDYQALVSHWAALHRSEQRPDLSAGHYLLYMALRGKDWRKAFTAISNSNKLANGAYPDWGLWRALNALHNRQDEEDLLAPFGGLVTPEMLRLVRELAPRRTYYDYKPQAFADRQFPFEAYQALPQSLWSTVNA